MNNVYCSSCKYYLDTCMGQKENIFEIPSCYEEYQEEQEEYYDEY